MDDAERALDRLATAAVDPDESVVGEDEIAGFRGAVRSALKRRKRLLRRAADQLAEAGHIPDDDELCDGCVFLAELVSYLDGEGES